jgi:hypothetical protein
MPRSRTGTTALSNRYVQRIPPAFTNKPFFRYYFADPSRGARKPAVSYAPSGDPGCSRTHASVWVSQNK